MPFLEWFPFYHRGFWASERVVAMNNREIGIYVRLLSLQWENGSISGDLNLLARICQESPKDFSIAWRTVGPCFKKCADDRTRLFNERMAEVRAEQLALHEDRQRALEEARELGRKGAEKRWHTKAGANGKANGVANGDPIRGANGDPNAKEIERELKTTSLDKSNSVVNAASLSLAARKPRTIEQLTKIINDDRPPSMPEGMPIDWPNSRDDIISMRGMALYFIGEFCNVSDLLKIEKQVGDYTNALVTMRDRGASTFAAWGAFHRLRAALQKPIFGARAKDAVRHLTSRPRTRA